MAKMVKASHLWLRQMGDGCYSDSGSLHFRISLPSPLGYSSSSSSSVSRVMKFTPSLSSFSSSCSLPLRDETCSNFSQVFRRENVMQARRQQMASPPGLKYTQRESHGLPNVGVYQYTGLLIYHFLNCPPEFILGR